MGYKPDHKPVVMDDKPIVMDDNLEQVAIQNIVTCIKSRTQKL